jgi:hypothetical protein
VLLNLLIVTIVVAVFTEAVRTRVIKSFTEKIQH